MLTDLPGQSNVHKFPTQKPTKVGKALWETALCKISSKFKVLTLPLQKYICWLPYPQNHITSNAPYGTGNATHTGAVIFKGDITGTNASKAGSPYPQTYFTGIAPKYDIQYR